MRRQLFLTSVVCMDHNVKYLMIIDLKHFYSFIIDKMMQRFEGINQLERYSILISIISRVIILDYNVYHHYLTLERLTNLFLIMPLSTHKNLVQFH